MESHVILHETETLNEVVSLAIDDGDDSLVEEFDTDTDVLDECAVDGATVADIDPGTIVEHNVEQNNDGVSLISDVLLNARLVWDEGGETTVLLSTVIPLRDG